MKLRDLQPSWDFINAIALIGYFVIPAIVYFSIGVARGEMQPVYKFSPQLFIPNYLIFAAPHILWAIVSIPFGFSAYTIHGGYLGATIALLSLQVLFKCCVDNSNAMGWLYYWPLAILLVVVCAGIGAAVNERISQK